MPKVIKKKSVKKKFVQEEEVKSAALQALDTIKERQKQVIIVVAAVVALFIVIAVISLLSVSKYKEANRLEREATSYYYGEKEGESLSGDERLKKALELFGKSVTAKVTPSALALELFGKSVTAKVTPSALYYLGNSYYSLGEYENAIKEYERFISKFSNEKILLPLVYQKLALSFFKTDKNKEALDTLDRLARVEGGIFKDTALINQAKYYEGAGDQEKAMGKYRELAEGFPTSPWSAEANSKLAIETDKSSEELKEEVKEGEGKAEEKKEEEPRSE
jgi:tetratricopeptide (TPR) repeat protein